MNILKDSVMEFHLEQITPMIHFQGEEDGAGIRASDLKPRFDVFLKKYWYDSETEEKRNAIETCILKQNESEKQQDGENEKIAFDYKVKIINEKKDDNITFYKNMKANRPTFYGSFYGKLQDGKNSFYKDVTVVFISRHEELREKIKDLFPVFLAVNSFGLRNNKGYGYFKIKDKKETEIIEHIKKYQELENQYVKDRKDFNKEKGVGIYQLKIKNKAGSKNEKIQRLLDEINAFHHILKSGNNHKAYIPSFMLKKHKESSKATLEKKALKLFLKKNKYDISELTKRGDISRNDRLDNLDTKNLYYVRGLLGLAPFYEFRDVKKNEKDKYGFTARFNVEIEGTERYTSPMKYLPISEEEIIILVNYSKVEEFRQKARSVFFSLDEVRGKNTVSSGFHAEIPNENQYSIHQLFKKSGVIEENLREYTEEMKKIQYNREWKYSVISDIEIG